MPASGSFELERALRVICCLALLVTLLTEHDGRNDARQAGSTRNEGVVVRRRPFSFRTLI
jgi:hypothetical protein